MKAKAFLPKGSEKRFNRIILLGGTSEIGLAIAENAKEELGDTSATKILRVQRTVPLEIQSDDHDFFEWNPTSAQEVANTIDGLEVTARDLVILSIGTLELDVFTLDELTTSVDLVEKNIFTNGTLPILSLLALCEKMIALGGGSIVVLSSVAAFPVLESNSIYSASKRLLDEIAQSILCGLRMRGIQLVIVRPGFVKTKLHRSRTSSPLSTNCKNVSSVTLKMLSQQKSGVVWVPGLWAPVSWVLSSVPLAKKVASSIMGGARVRGE
jgi:decaprenylphospho-beta-D-erythro-pentofuranosid-2-ulose 2-reductase